VPVPAERRDGRRVHLPAAALTHHPAPLNKAGLNESPALLSFTSYGVRLGVEVSDAALLPRVWEQTPPGARAGCSARVDRRYSLSHGALYADGDELERSADVEDLLDTLHRDMQVYVADRARNRVFVHAGVVGWQGSAILLPAQTFGGKSTLVAALVRAGATYYSDEYAVLDARGWVHPYPRALRLRRSGSRRWQTCTAEALGGTTGAEPLRVELVALTTYRQGARWQPARVSPGRGILALLSNTVPARRKPEAVMRTLAELARGATFVESERGEADETAALLLAGLHSQDALFDGVDQDLRAV
jgi:hypothetical protein